MKSEMEMVDAWTVCLEKGPPYIFRGDDLDESGKVLIRDHDDFVQSESFGCKDDRRVHVGLLPQPYIGNLRTASFVLLSLNPGLNYGEYCYELNEPYRKALCTNIRQGLDRQPYPFIFLNPEFAWHSGFIYWTKHMTELIAAIKEGGLARDFEGALKFLAQRIACIELFPYHSWKAPKLNHRKLNSSQFAINFVNNVLVPRARKGECVLLALRRPQVWSQKGSGAKVHRVRSPQAGSVSKKNCGSSRWRQILEVLKR